jgi:type VI secretion system protein ImpM
MSRATLNERLQIGWFGKLPGVGDFAHRRLPRDLLNVLDDWLRHGLAELQQTHPDTWRELFTGAPAWNCAIPAATTGGYTLVGILAPSRDRVGRLFPLCAGIALPADESVGGLIAQAHGWLQQLAQRILEARDRQQPIEVFDAAICGIDVPPAALACDLAQGGDDILSVLGAEADVRTVPLPTVPSLPWPELPLLFDPRQDTAYWWTVTGNGHPLRGFTTENKLAPSLLVTLVQPLIGRDAGSST